MAYTMLTWSIQLHRLADQLIRDEALPDRNSDVYQRHRRLIQNNMDAARLADSVLMTRNLLLDISHPSVKTSVNLWFRSERHHHVALQSSTAAVDTTKPGSNHLFCGNKKIQFDWTYSDLWLAFNALSSKTWKLYVHKFHMMSVRLMKD